MTQNNSLVLGGISGTNGGTDTKVGIGTTASTAKLTVSGNGVFSASGAARFDLFNTTANCGYSQQVTDAGLWQLATNAGTTRMVLDPSGKVGIGTPSPGEKLQVVGDLKVGIGNNGCVKDGNNTIIAGTCSSDARLKRDVTPLPKLLDKLVQLQPVHFYWRTDQFPEKHFGPSQSFGLVAQDVEKVMPELAGEDESGYKVVRYSKLPLLMLQAIKELKSENDELKQKLQTANQQQEQIKQQQVFIEARLLGSPESRLL